MNSDEMLTKAIDSKVVGKRERPKMTWKRQVKEQIKKKLGKRKRRHQHSEVAQNCLENSE